MGPSQSLDISESIEAGQFLTPRRKDSSLATLQLRVMVCFNMQL